MTDATEMSAETGLDVGAEHREFREKIRRFLKEHLSPALRAAASSTPTVFAEPEIGREWQKILYAQGWLAYNWPAEFGGTGWSHMERYIFERECALANAPGLPVLGLKLLAPVLHAFGTPRQQQEYLPKILSGEHYWCQGFSEAEAGSDLASLRTGAVRAGDHYVVNGTKLWTTHAQFADHMFCLARTDTQAAAQRGISFLLIDMNQPGVHVRPIITLAGDHEVNEVRLDSVRVPAEDLVGAEGQGWSIAKFLLENERAGSCFAPKLLADLWRMRCEARHQPGSSGLSLLDDPLFAARLARLELEAQALEITELRILEQLGQGERPGPQSSIVKLAASELRRHIDALNMSMFGYAGLQLETARPLYGPGSPKPVCGAQAQVSAPRYLNSQAWSIFGGSNEVQRTIIAKSVLML
jgi:alkylation response protein AidB-like acyl-CoA dehydrogenase